MSTPIVHDERQWQTAGYLNWIRAAEFTGLSVSTLRRLAREGRLRTFRPTVGRTLLSKAELSRLIETSEVANAKNHDR